MYYKDTEVARNCNVFNDHQALSRIIDARRGTGRLPQGLAGMVPPAAGGTYMSPSKLTRSASPVAIAAWR